MEQAREELDRQWNDIVVSAGDVRSARDQILKQMNYLLIVGILKGDTRNISGTF